MLDYSWGCDKMGNSKCFNTHGSTDPNDWTVVNNTANCAGTDKPPCGAGPLGTGVGRKGPTNSAFDYVVKHATNGKVYYFGVMVNGDDETAMQIPPEMYQQLTGQNHVYTGDGTYVFNRPRKFGPALISYTRQLGQKRGYSRAVIDKVVSLLPMMSQALMYLDYKRVPVADLNDPYEVFTKYMHYHDFAPQNIQPAEYNMLMASINGGPVAKANHVNIPKKGSTAGPPSPTPSGGSSGGFDFSGMIGGIMSMFQGMLQQGVAVADQHELTQWVAAFENYMKTDFADITREQNERGPQAALTWLLRLKDTSWKDLKNYITTWCAQHAMEIPDEVVALQEAQATLEAKLEDLVNQSGGGQSPPGAGQSKPTQNGEFNPNTNHTASPIPGAGFDMNQMFGIAILVVAIIFLTR